MLRSSETKAGRASPPNCYWSRLSPNLSSPSACNRLGGCPVSTNPLMDDSLNRRVAQGQQGVGKVVAMVS